MKYQAGSTPGGASARALCNQLMDLATAIDLIGHASASRLGINQTDLICLNLVARHGPMGMSEIAAATGLTTAAISGVAARLEAGGYARREMDPADRRRVRLFASEEGAKRAFSLFDTLYQAAVELQASDDPRTVEMLIDLIARFRALITDYAQRLEPTRAGPPPRPHVPNI